MKLKFETIILIILLPFALLLSCDDGNSNNSSCTTEEDLAVSECPASTLADFCGQFLCPITNLPDGLTGDVLFPQCDQDCVVIDCTTLMCGGSTFTGLTITVFEGGGIEVSSDSFFCLGAAEICE